MKNGRIVEVGKPSEIYRSPSNIFTENFVGETNLLEGRVLETDTSNCIVDIRGHRLRVAGLERKVDQPVVVAIRPESIQLTTQSDVGWPGVIKQVTFLGDVNRYVVDIERGIEIIAEESTAVYSTGFRTGESVGVLVVSDAHMLIFDHPKDGLEKEVSLE
jgi:spermidine/putrescine transport system ATP-binding protein